MAATSNATGGGASSSPGPLRGITVLEIAGLAPAPFAGLILQDFGANVIRIDRPLYANTDCLHRGKRSVAINLKKPEGVALVKELAAKADVLIEPFRPGVMEKLGLGPDVLLEVNPRLVFARMTGWGQTGSYAKTAGHDINYIALSGALSLLGRKHENPAFPINILGDFAGGGMLCAMGILLALLERGVSGRGQVVDAAMVEGASYLVSMLRNFDSSGFLPAARGENMLNSGAHFYEVYKTKDGKFVSIGAIEPHFYAQLLEGLGLADDDSLPAQMDQSQWPAMKEKFTALFASKTRDEWCAIFEGTDACFAPVLELDEVATHPHTKERRLLVPREGNPDILEAAPAPLLSRTPGLPSGVAPRGPEPGQHSLEILAEFGVASDRVASLVASGVVADSSSKRSKL